MAVQAPKVLSATTLRGDRVTNVNGEDLGEIEEIMIDLDRGRVAYVVISFGSRLMGRDKLFAVPWEILTISHHDKKFILNVSEEILKKAPGFDKDKWPDSSDLSWLAEVYQCYDCIPYWEE